jgi:hypothetical protein
MTSHAVRGRRCRVQTENLERGKTVGSLEVENCRKLRKTFWVGVGQNK